jgi:ParB family transcriptional regulator, chromosome partitioning protein
VATPFQRDLSRTHATRLVDAIGAAGVFLDPVIAVPSKDGFWSPNGRHRLEAARRLGMRTVTALLVPDEKLAFRILALNTEKAHNLRDKALEVIRMYRARLEAHPRRAEKEFAFEFERAHFITLGLLYEKKPKFSGGAYAPLLSRVDNFLAQPLKEAIGEREERAEQVERADELVTELVVQGKKRGLVHPYLKNFIIARSNPLTRARKTIPTCHTALNSLIKALSEFDLDKIHFGQIRAAAQIAAATATE